MNRRVLSQVLLSLLLVVASTSAFNIRPVRASVVTYIRADGSVDPVTAPIQPDGNVYTFTDDVHSALIIEKDNIVVDGADHQLEGTGNGVGVSLSERNNITIKNMNISLFSCGIRFDSSSDNTISGNSVIDNNDGIILSESSNNTISGNSVIDNNDGIILSESSNNTISGNSIIDNNERGVYLSLSQSNNISENDVANNHEGIWLSSCPENTLSRNNMTGNYCNFCVLGESLSDFINYIDDSNTVNGKPIYYWIGKQHLTVPLDAGYIFLVDCTNITIRNVNLSRNRHGISLFGTANSTIVKNNITNVRDGVWLKQSSDNTISENNVADNNNDGIILSESSNNTISGNSIIDNNGKGVHLYMSSYVIVSMNNIMSNNGVGIYLFQSVHNTFSDNNVTYNGSGFSLSQSSYNIVLQNNVTNNHGRGAIAGASSNYNNISENNIEGNGVDGIRIYSSYNVVSNNNITHNGWRITEGEWSGICLMGPASHNNISGNNIVANHGRGFFFIGNPSGAPRHCRIYRNLVEGNWRGIKTDDGLDNIIYHNNFVSNHIQVERFGGSNVWDDGYPSGGNYWSDYQGVDHSGLGYPPKVIGYGTQDNYPLMGRFYFFETRIPSLDVEVISNSTVLDFYFNPEEGSFIRFTVTGQDATVGFCRVTIPNQLIWCDNPEQWQISVNDALIEHRQVIEDNGYTHIYFTYTQSAQNVAVIGEHVIPEFHTWITLLLTLVFVTVAAVIFKRKGQKFRRFHPSNDVSECAMMSVYVHPSTRN